MTRILGEGWALPGLDDTNRAFFTSGVLALQQCKSCRHVQHPPEDVCSSCQGTTFDAFKSAGRGRIESVAVVHHPVHPALADHVPYAIVLVSVADAPGVLITGNVAGTAPDAVKIGAEVRVVFERTTDPSDGQVFEIPQWEIVA
jgi:uncharacterized OB-fold protein